MTPVNSREINASLRISDAEVENSLNVGKTSEEDGLISHSSRYIWSIGLLVNI